MAPVKASPQGSAQQYPHTPEDLRKEANYPIWVRLRSGDRAARDELRVGDRIALTFRLTEGGPELALEADVRRIEILDEGRIWQAACHFVDIQPAQSEQIVQFIFAQQRAVARSRR